MTDATSARPAGECLQCHDGFAAGFYTGTRSIIFDDGVLIRDFVQSNRLSITCYNLLLLLLLALYLLCFC